MLTLTLNHLDLQVSDVPRTVAFFESMFGLALQSRRTSPAIAFLTDGSGFVLVLQRAEAPSYPAGFHFGFLVDDPAIVHSMHARLEAAGHEVSAVMNNNRGTMIYCRAPDGYTIEVSCRRRGPGASTPATPG